MARSLALKKIAAAIREASGELLPDEALDPGCMRLYSYYRPGLEAGRFGIEAIQVVKASQIANDGSLQKKQIEVFNYTGDNPDNQNILLQNFEVLAPQFSIDASKINSYYPPNGHSDEGRILPHIVFNDPHFPWVRYAGHRDGCNLDCSVDPDPAGSTNFRNQVPWFAVVVFDPTEIAIAPADAKNLGLVASDGSVVIKSYDPLKLPTTGAFPMKVQEYLASIKSRVKYEAVFTDPSDPDWLKMQASTEVTNVIFPTKARFSQLFGASSDTTCNVLQQFKYLSHVRHINTMGFPDAGVEEEGYFSISISATMGDIKTKVPKTQIVHLVSLEHLDATMIDSNHGIPSTFSDRIGLISLFSWTYTVIPEGPSFVSEMENLRDTAQYLQPPLPLLQSFSQNASTQADSNVKTASNFLLERLKRGFTINRWRTATGEETAAFNRGPLTPEVVPHHPKDPNNPSSDDWVGMSMHGKEFQIWDSKLGMMDLTYYNAWNLGRLASISDGPFNGALLRFRSVVWKWASSKARNAVNNMTASSDVLASVPTLVTAIHTITPAKFQGDVSRINPPVKDPVAPPLTHPSVAPVFAKAIAQEVDKATSVGETLYTDFCTGKANNADWISIFNWIQDALFLAKIPAHYLFHEPSHIKGPPVLNATPGSPSLPPEALRFFHIDDTWMDCFIDGALSVANHLEPDFDRTRVRIKEVLNYYFANPVVNSGMKPIIPRSGFIIRSAVVKSIPDLRITASTGVWDNTLNKWIEYQDAQGKVDNPIVRLTRLDDFTILCLFDCALAEVWQIKLAQPPHQQRYAVAAGFAYDSSGLTVQFAGRQLYMQNPPGKGDAGWPELSIPSTDTKTPLTFFDQDTRCIYPGIMAAKINSWAQSANYTDTIPNSAELGLELNDPSYQLDLLNTLAAPKTKADVPPTYIRQFWVKPGEDPLANSVDNGAPSPHDAKATITNSKAVANVVKKLQVTSKALAPSTISTPPKQEDFSHPALPPAPRKQISRVIAQQPAMKTTIPPSVKAVAGPPPAQYKLMVCVDYRPAPPTPKVDLTTGKSLLYAPYDYIPTTTAANTYLDLMIVVVRVFPHDNTGLNLARIDVELPVFDTKPGKQSVEPLLTSEPYIGHARMARNLHFVPTLYNNELATGARPILGIRLLPRSSDTNATIPVAANTLASLDATVRLSMCRIAPIVNKLLAPVATIPVGQPKTPPLPKNQWRGRCSALLRETYSTGDTRQPTVMRETNVDVMKMDLGSGVSDVDIYGNPVNPFQYS